MTETTVVHLMRHGEVDNPAGVLYGRIPDFHLSELGQKMALRVAEYVTGRDIVELVSSPLERAQETMEPVAAVFGIFILFILLKPQGLFRSRFSRTAPSRSIAPAPVRGR